ncbi:MAG: hypothetical protein AAGA25_05450 [Planctomycetota bacterium]
MNWPLPEHTLTLNRMVGFSLAMVFCLAATPGCQPPTIATETPTEFSIEHARIIDSPNRYGGSASDETLQLLEQRIRDYGLTDDDVWFIYLRASSKYDFTRYYAEVYRLPQQIEGRLYSGEFVVLRTEAVDEEMAEIMDKFEEPVPSPVHPYMWVQPETSATVSDGLESIGLNTLPITPVTHLPQDRLISLIELIRTPPQMPDTFLPTVDPDPAFKIVMPGKKVKSNRPIWQIEGTPDEPEVYLLNSDRRRKRGQLVYLAWTGDRYKVKGIGLYGTQTGWLGQY